jgi:hypothetical protein
LYMTSCPTAPQLTGSLRSYLPNSVEWLPYDQIGPPQITTAEEAIGIGSKAILAGVSSL